MINTAGDDLAAEAAPTHHERAEQNMAESNSTLDASNAGEPDVRTGTKPGGAAEARALPVDADLSAEIIRSVEKRPEDRVTCRRIYGDNYRCNWWSPADRSAYDNPGMLGLLVTTHHVRKSQFLRARRTAAGDLVITVPPSPQR